MCVGMLKVPMRSGEAAKHDAQGQTASLVTIEAILGKLQASAISKQRC